MTADYRIAGFPITIHLPDSLDAGTLLPSFAPFRTVESKRDARLFDFTVLPAGNMPDYGAKELLEETDNDMGHLSLYAVPDGYRVEITQGRYRHQMVAAADFSSAEACLQQEDPSMGNALSSLLRVAYSQAILNHDAVSIHAAAVYNKGEAYLFMGASGTGKSTHASLWMKHIPQTGLLNDDNPTIRIVDGRAYVYGTPWSGKTACYKNLSFPVGGMVRLKQASVNRFFLREGIEAFAAVYPGCSVIAQDERLRNRLYDTAACLAGLVTVGTLECLPDREAALVCHEALAGDREKPRTNNM